MKTNLLLKIGFAVAVAAAVLTLPTAASAQTTEADLRARAEKGDTEAMYRLGLLLDDPELIMDLESIRVAPSPGAERSREAYYWYDKAAKQKHYEAWWKKYCMALYPREGVDLTPSQREVIFQMKDMPTRQMIKMYSKYLRHNVEYLYSAALGAYLINTPDAHFGANYMAARTMQLLKKDPSHPYYGYANVIADRTRYAKEAHTMEALGMVAGIFSAAYSGGMSSGTATPTQALTHSLNTIDNMIAADKAQAQTQTQAQPAQPAALTATALQPPSMAGKWRIRFQPEYIALVAAQCGRLGVEIPRHVLTGYSDETFASAADAMAWLHGKFSQSDMSDLYRQDRVGMPEQIME